MHILGERDKEVITNNGFSGSTLDLCNICVRIVKSNEYNIDGQTVVSKDLGQVSLFNENTTVDDLRNVKNIYIDKHILYPKTKLQDKYNIVNDFLKADICITDIYKLNYIYHVFYNEKYNKYICLYNEMCIPVPLKKDMKLIDLFLNKTNEPYTSVKDVESFREFVSHHNYDINVISDIIDNAKYIGDKIFYLICSAKKERDLLSYEAVVNGIQITNLIDIDTFLSVCDKPEDDMNIDIANTIIELYQNENSNGALIDSIYASLNYHKYRCSIMLLHDIFSHKWDLIHEHNCDVDFMGKYLGRCRCSCIHIDDWNLFKQIIDTHDIDASKIMTCHYPFVRVNITSNCNIPEYTPNLTFTDPPYVGL